MNSKKFWNNIFSDDEMGHYKTIEYNLIDTPDLEDPILTKALSHFGIVKNKTILDLGCGRASSSIFFAYHGANVISIDFSENAVNNLKNYCKSNGINNIKPIVLNANEINTIDKVDFVFGSMILHHIEPFDIFSDILRQSIKDDGRAFFLENNARSSLIMWFRKHLVGKLWIPKYGDPDEHPLTLDEINELKKYFKLKIETPEFYYFRLISIYLLRGYFRKQFTLIDQFFYKFHRLHKYSFRQYIYLS